MRSYRMPVFGILLLAANAALVAGALPATADASTVVYVNNTAGSNCWIGGPGTQTQPYCTISAATAAVQAGQTINITGRYNENLTIARSGTADQPITVQAFGSAVLTGVNAGINIEGQHDVSVIGVRLTEPQVSPAVRVDNASAITLRDISLSATHTPAAIVGFRLNNVTNSSLTGVEADGYGITTGLVLDGPTRGVVVRHAVANADHAGGQAAIDVAGSNNTILNSMLRGGAVAGIVLEAGAADNTIANDMVSGGLADGIDNHGATGTVLTSNEVSGNCGTGIRVDGASSGLSLQNNVSHDNPAPGGCTPKTADPVDIGVYGTTAGNTVVDYNNVFQSVTGAEPYARDTPMSLTEFRTATGQAAHDVDSNDPGVNVDSANSAATGYQSTDAYGINREDDPAVPNTGVGPIAYADRGPVENVPGPMARLGVTVNPDGSVTAFAASVPERLPIVSYTFDFGDHSPPVTQSTGTATHQYAQHGVYLVKVIVTDNKGHTSEATWTGCAAPFATGSAARRLTADFNADGRDDAALMYDYGGGHVALFTIANNGCGQFGPDPDPVWDAPQWGTGTRFMTTGDFNGDGRSDFALFYDYGGGHEAVYTLTSDTSSRTGFSAPTLAWEAWAWGSGTKFMTTGDFNGDGKRDLALTYDYGGGHVAVFTLTANANGDGHFAAAALRWDGPLWGPGTRFATAGDFNGDGKDDLALFYQYGGGHVAAFTLPAATDGGLSAPVLQWNGPVWGDRTEFASGGDLNGDGKDDLALFYDYGGSNALFSLAASSGGDGSLAAPSQLWSYTGWGTATIHRFMVTGNLADPSNDSVLLFEDNQFSNRADLQSIDPNPTGGHAGPTVIWQGDMWGKGTKALG